MNEKLKLISRKRLITMSIAIILLFIFIYFYFFFQTIEKSKVVDFDKTKDFILTETEITSIDNTYHFQDEEAYHIVYGKDKENKQWIVFTKLSKSLSADDLIIIPADTVLTKDQVESKWAEQCNQCTLTGSNPAMLNKQPLWELSYTDHSNRYVIEYVLLEDGSTYEKLKLHRKYNKKG